ncbi:MAG: glucoamylase family protein, partial [Paracoccaceae bacterium]
PLERITEAAASADALIGADTAAPEDWTARLRAAIENGVAAQDALRQSLLESAGRAHDIAMGMDFGLLYDAETRTFFIGYNLSVDRMDQHRYDLLASEARLASYFAIAKGDVPVAHWFHLGRPITRSAGQLTVLSWNGSMFEYLMPALLLRSEPGRLLGQSEIAAVAVQRRYGEQLGLPWGVSEAAFATRDSAHRYQYRAFGVNGLGLKQGLTDDYVVAPYASALALSVSPGAAVRNLRRLDKMGLQGRYGFFDSVDFTPDRKPPEGDFTPVRTFMAHHQGMLLAAIDNALNANILVRRFARDPRIAAMDLLLQERVPWEYVPETLPEPEKALPDLARKSVPHLDGWDAPETRGAQLHLIGNGRLSSWITDTGGGALWWHDQSLTRWTGDPERDDGGARLFLRDPATGATWSFGRRPPDAPDQQADVQFHPGKAVFHQNDHGIAATLEITVAEGDDVEIRRVTLINDGPQPREIELTSHAEVVLAPFASHERHPAFSKLFVHSEFLPDLGALLFTRRPRRPGDGPPVLLHRLLTDGGPIGMAGFETDRRA